MFEDSLLSPRVGERNRIVRAAMIFAAVLQCSLAAALWIAPLLHPERLSLARLPTFASLMPVPHPPKPRVEPVSHVRSSQAPSAQVAMPSVLSASPRIPRNPVAADPAPAASLADLWAGTQTGPPAALQQMGTGPTVRVTAAGAGTTGRGANRVRVSSGVSSGLLLAPIRPLYPRIASSARIEGTVTVEAVISRTGEVLRAHVTSGPPLLAGAALDAVERARYRPYQLNGEPTEVETTFSVIFRLGS